MGQCICGHTSNEKKNCDGTHKVVKAVKEQIAQKIEAMKFEPNPNHDRHEALIAKSYWEEAKLEAERFARGQK